MSECTTTKKVAAYGQAAEEMAQTVSSNLCDAVETVTDNAKELASSMTEKGKAVAQYVGHQVVHAAETVGGHLKQAGVTVSKNGPQEGTLGEASTVVAKSLEEAGDYLQREGMQGVVGNLKQMVQKNPIPALLAGVAVGFLISRASSPRN